MVMYELSYQIFKDFSRFTKLGSSGQKRLQSLMANSYQIACSSQMNATNIEDAIFKARNSNSQTPKSI